MSSVPTYLKNDDCNVKNQIKQNPFYDVYHVMLYLLIFAVLGVCACVRACVRACVCVCVDIVSMTSLLCDHRRPTKCVQYLIPGNLPRSSE